jgi:ketosteroid isomerase-like protein
MIARGLTLASIIVLMSAPYVVAQDAPEPLTGRQAEVASVVDSLLKAMLAQDIEAVKQALRLPLLAAVAGGDGPPTVIEVPEEALAQQISAANDGRYGVASQVELVKPTVGLIAWNIAVLDSPVHWKDDAGGVLLDEHIAALLARQDGGWRVCAMIVSRAPAPQLDEATRREIPAVIDGALGAIVQQDENAYLAAYSPPVASMDAEFGSRRLGPDELQAQFRQFMYLLVDAGVTNLAVDTQRLTMLGPGVACAMGVAKGLDGAGTNIGYRPQALLLVKIEGQWKIVAEAAGLAEEGTPPAGLLGLPSEK